MDMRIGWDLALWAMLLAFALSMVVAWTYILTYQGLSYSRGFVQTLAIGGTISALVMLAIGDDIARGIGLVGALTVIRFRSTLKDTRDLMFVFTSLAVGVACGVQAFSVAVVGTLTFVAGWFFLAWSNFGSRQQFNAVLRLHLPSNPFQQKAFQEVLARYCRSSVLINLRDVGTESQEHAYHVKLSDPATKGKFVAELTAVPGLVGITLLMQDTAIEV
jgi:uncharacterized membrane protein YhiD involved in acid resistance